MENEIDIKVRAELQARWGNASALIINEDTCTARFDATGHNNQDMVELQDYLRVAAQMDKGAFFGSFNDVAIIEELVAMIEEYMYQEYIQHLAALQD